MPYLTPDESDGAYLCRSLRFRAELASYITGALELLTERYAWEQYGDLTVDEVTLMATDALNFYLESGDMCRIGTLVDYITATPPEGVLPLDGTTYIGADYPDLFAIIHPNLDNGDGTFTLPDARGRVPVGAGAGSGLTNRSIGDSFGTEQVTLTEAQIPAHTHTYEKMDPPVPAQAGELAGIIVADDVNTQPTGTTGGGEAHDNMPPGYVAYVGVYWK